MTRASGARLRRVALLAATAFALLTVPAMATDPDSLTARQRYLAGAQAYAAGKYAEAVDQFIAADRIAPSAALSFDIARSYEKLGQSSLALRWFRDYLHRTGGDPADGPKVRKIVQSLEHELRDKGVQQTTVRSVPRGGTVTIDGEPAGVTPWTGDLPPGRHRLAVAYDGYERNERWFVLPPDHAIDVDVRLARAEPKAAAVVATPDAAPALPQTAPPAATPVSTPKPEKAVPSAATAPVSLPEPSSSGSSAVRTIGIVAMGVGGAALGGALTFELLRRQAESDAKKDPTQPGYASKLDQANDRQMAARVLLGVGAGLVVTGGVMFFVGGPSSEHRTEIAMGCIPGQCGATASGRF